MTGQGVPWSGWAQELSQELILTHLQNGLACWAAWICTTTLGGKDPSGLIQATARQHRVRGSDSAFIAYAAQSYK